MDTKRQAASEIAITPEMAADRLSVSRSTIYALLKSGRIPSLKIGRSRQIRVSSLESYVRHLERETTRTHLIDEGPW